MLAYLPTDIDSNLASLAEHLLMAENKYFHGHRTNGKLQTIVNL